MWTKKSLYELQLGANNTFLRTISTPILSIDDTIRKLHDVLIDMMWEFDGVWLAAPQIGVNVRMFAYTVREKTKKWEKMLYDDVMINPVIIKHSDKQNIHEEWCLSLPNIFWKVRRYDWICVTYQDISWKKYTNKFTNLTARIIQHEIDHLDAILFIDKDDWGTNQ